MKQVITYLLLLGIGVLLGFLIFHESEKESMVEIKTVYKDKIKTKIVHDTVIIKASSPDKILVYDTLTVIDTTHFENTSKIDSTLNHEDEEVFDEDIITEKLISKRNVHLNTEQSDSLDTSELLNIKTKSFNENMTVEFWESPLELTGYELTRNKLKLFGFNPNESISLQFVNDSDQIMFRTETIELFLSKTKKFKSLNL